MNYIQTKPGYKPVSLGWLKVGIFLIVALAISFYYQMACFICSRFQLRDHAGYNWKEFSPPDGKCNLLLPGTPIHTSEKFAILIRRLDYTRDHYRCVFGNSTVYALDINTYPEELSNSVQQSLLIESLNEIVSDKERNRLMDTDFGETRGCRKLDYLVRLNENTFMKGRLIMTGRHQYHLKYVFRAGKFNEGEYFKFIESFRFHGELPRR